MSRESIRLFEVSEAGERLTFRIASDLGLVDTLVARLHSFFQNLGEEASPELRLVVRELVINAVEHGNGGDQEKVVSGHVERLEDARFRVAVEDEGAGVDPGGVDMAMPEDVSDGRHRGYPLIRAFSDGIEFEGSRVTVVLRNDAATHFVGREEDGWFVIRPTGNLTASVADRFRAYLSDVVDMGGHVKLRFDLSLVNDVDSMGLCVFVVLTKMLARSGQETLLEVVNASESVSNLFRMTRLDRLYTLSVA